MSLDTSRQLDFTRMRAFATGLLVLMAGLFVFSRLARHTTAAPWLAWVEAFSEAAMVGALADWFAVTALFRRPLGLPIPHTAIVPSNKDRIGSVLGEFVQSNFLSAEVLGRKLEELNLAERLTSWLRDEESSRRAAAAVLRLLPDLFSVIDDRVLRSFLRSRFRVLRQEVRMAPGVAAALEAVTEGDRSQHLFDEVLRIAASVLDEHRTFLRELLRQELPWYVPNFVHDKVYQDMIVRLEVLLREMSTDRLHPAREKFFQYLRRASVEIRGSERAEQRCQEIAAWVFENDAFAGFVDGIWDQAKAAMLQKLDHQSNQVRDLVQRALQNVGNALAHDPAMQEKINRFVVEAAQRLAHQYRAQISALITDTVHQWDAETIVQKLEEQVGRDLQYIRINGTLVGGSVGLLLHALSLYLP